MKIVVDRQTAEVRFGNERHFAFPVDEETHDLKCEPPFEIHFPDIANLRGNDLPERVCIETSDYDNEYYGYVCQIGAIHYGDRLRMIVHAGYEPHQWDEVVNLRHFYPHFVQFLKRTKRIKPIDGLDLDENGVAYLQVCADFPSSRRLSSARDEIVATLLSVHMKAVERVLWNELADIANNSLRCVSGRAANSDRFQ